MEDIDPNAIAVEKIVSKGLRKFIITVKDNVRNARVGLSIESPEKMMAADDDKSKWPACRWKEWKDC